MWPSSYDLTPGWSVNPVHLPSRVTRRKNVRAAELPDLFLAENCRPFFSVAVFGPRNLTIPSRPVLYRPVPSYTVPSRPVLFRAVPCVFLQLALSPFSVDWLTSRNQLRELTAPSRHPVPCLFPQVTLSPFNMDAPGGINSFMTSVMKPVLPLIFFAQFMYLYRCPLASDACLGWFTLECLHHGCLFEMRGIS